MRPTIGVQLSTIKQQVADLGVYEALRRCAEICMPFVEISQVPMTEANVSAIVQARNDFGIEVAAGSAAVEPMYPGAPGDSLSEQFDKIVADCRRLNCTALRIGMMPLPLLGDNIGSMKFIERAEAAAVRLAAEGIDLYYHNHHVELRLVEGTTLLQRMRLNTEVLGFELDIHWLHRGGVDPVAYIRDFAGRVRLLHLKDYRIAPFRMPEGPFNMDTFLPAFHGLVEFAEIGEGTLPIAACIEAGMDGGCEYFFIEQDDCYGRDPFDSLARSKANLVSLGFDWFARPSN
jgi:sugar phosphate isomerase/epimerase